MWNQLHGNVRGRAIIGTVLVAIVVGILALLLRPQARPLTSPGAAQPTINCSSSVIQAAIPNVPPVVSAATVAIPAGEPVIVATVNGTPIAASVFEAQAATTWQTNQRTLKTLPANAPTAARASASASLSAVRQAALHQLIVNELWLQAGQRAGLQVSAAKAQSFMISQTNQTESQPVDSQGRVSFEAYLCSRHESIQSYEDNPQLIAAYQDILTRDAARTAYLATLTPTQRTNESAALQAHEQALWNAATIKIYVTFTTQ